VSARELEQARRLYRTSAEYRQKAIDRSAKYNAANSSDPDYCRLVQLRKDIHRLRDSRDARLKHAANLDARIVVLARELVKVHAKWKAKKARAKG
jgi:hypothetical protein